MTAPSHVSVVRSVVYRAAMLADMGNHRGASQAIGECLSRFGLAPGGPAVNAWGLLSVAREMASHGNRHWAAMIARCAIPDDAALEGEIGSGDAPSANGELSGPARRAYEEMIAELTPKPRAVATKPAPKRAARRARS
jgi:hypothetical protein